VAWLQPGKTFILNPAAFFGLTRNLFTSPQFHDKRKPMSVGKPAWRGSPEEAQERLLVQAAQQDPHRFADLYERNFERVYVYVVRRVRRRDLAEDLTAEVFHKALSNLPRFDWRGIPFAAWLLRIASNLIADRWKQDAREIVEDPPEQSAESNLDQIEDCARLFRLVGQLPKDQQRVIVMRFSEEKSIKEIAEKLGRTEGSVKQLQFRAIKNLREQLVGKHA
jgi:RNA polymerase sigma-70 factor, ECF subfamily